MSSPIIRRDFCPVLHVFLLAINNVMDGTYFRELVSGRRHGFAAAAIRALLSMFEIPYSGVMSLRNWFYDTGLLPSHRVRFPVLSVGNLTLGGTGKTPMVAWLARWFLELGIQPGLISRGYRSQNGKNDEFLELLFRLPSVPHCQNKNRVAAVDELLTQHHPKPVDVLILDDAFQHRRLARDLDIVLLDASEPFGWERVFPRGTLRESLAGLRRADIVLLSKADVISEPERGKIRSRVQKIAPNVVWGEIVHRPQSLVTLDKQEKNLESIRGKRALAFCGIGNPEAFRQTLLDRDVELAEFISFPDHHYYTPRDLVSLDEAASRSGAEILLCTMKDMVKIPSPCTLPIEAVLIDIAIISGEDELRQSLVRFSEGME